MMLKIRLLSQPHRILQNSMVSPHQTKKQQAAVKMTVPGMIPFSQTRGDEDGVRLLLEAGANVNAQGGEYDNALQAACFRGHEAVIRLLLEAGANVNAQGGIYGNALRAASIKGHEAVVRLLLEAGADSSRVHAAQLPVEIDSDERLMNPSKYFEELERLETEVFLHSAFGKLGSDGLRTDLDAPSNLVIEFPYPKDHFKPEIDDVQALETCNVLLAKLNPSEDGAKKGSRNFNHAISDQVLDSIRSFLHLIECRNVVCAVSANLSRLSRAKYCTTYISLLALERDRNVARLVRLYTSEVTMIGALFDHALRARYMHIYSLTETELLNPDDRELVFRKLRNDRSAEEEKLSRECVRLLVEKTGLQYSESRNDAFLWRCLVHTLDLAVLSYVGAHVGDFEERYLSENLNTSLDPSPQQEATTMRQPAQGLVDLGCGVRFSRWHHLRCLDPFLGHQPVWIFQTGGFGTSSLYLSTDIQTFADIWGPLWKVSSKLEPQIIVQYNVGGGAIKRCPAESDMMAPPLQDNEVFAHWDSTVERTSVDSQLPEEAKTINLHFKEHDVLLIGGSSNKLVSNPRCRCDSSQISQEFQDTRCLQQFGTSKSSRVQDAETVQVQVGGGGVHVGYQRSFKLRTARTWKQALLESWENSPERRNPWILLHRCGVEISTCTRNSRRISLIEILRTQTMRNIMELYTWKTQSCQESFCNALNSKDLLTLSRLIFNEKGSERRGEFGSALSICFKALSTTGLCDNAELSLLWAPQPGFEYLAKLLRSEHTWTGFLKDSIHSCTFAVLENSCLISTYSNARECQSSEMSKFTGYSVFETMIIVNERIIPDGIRRRRAKTWDVSKISPGYSFEFGDQGKLIVMAPQSRSQLLAYWRPHRSERLHEIKEMVNEVIGREAGIYHREYNQTEPVDIRPIPVLVVSDQREPC